MGILREIPKMKINLFLLTSAFGAFKKGEDYDVHCTSGGIHLSSYNSQFVLTAKSKTKDPKCVENTEFYPLTGLTNMFIPNCLTIQEHFKSWNGVVITKKDGPRSRTSETIFITCYYDVDFDPSYPAQGESWDQF